MNGPFFGRTPQLLALGSVLLLVACGSESKTHPTPSTSGGSSSGGSGTSSSGVTSGGTTSGGTTSGGTTSGGTTSGGTTSGGTTSGGSTSGGTPSGAVFRVNSEGRITRNGTVLPFHCGSWFGLQGRQEENGDAPMELYIGNTFWGKTGRTIQQTMTELTNFGINVVRMPVVHQTLDNADKMGTGNVLKNDPSVRVEGSLNALEQWIKLAAKNNIQVLLDIHSCSNYVDWRKGRLDARPPYTDTTRNNYKYKRDDCSCAADGNPPGMRIVQPYNKQLWLEDLKKLAGLAQKLGVDNILGIDIFNEPWDYTWEEWKGLAEEAYAAINSVNPNLLIFVQGVSNSAGNQGPYGNKVITKTPHGDAGKPSVNPNWGENLYGAKALPLNIPRERLVYSPHTYGPSVAVQPHFMDPTQPECAGLEGDAVAATGKCRIVINANKALLEQGWEEHFGYLRDSKFAVMVGEFGGNMEWPGGKASLRDQDMWGYLLTLEGKSLPRAGGTLDIDEQWQNLFVDYMKKKGIEGCYWSINPESGDTGGLYGHVYDPISNTGAWGQWTSFDQNPKRTALLKKLWGQ